MEDLAVIVEMLLLDSTKSTVSTKWGGEIFAKQ
jgi:hypothetical protein